MRIDLAAQKAKTDRVSELEAELLTANRQKEENARSAEDALHKLAAATASENETIKRLREDLANAQQELHKSKASGTTNAADFAEKLRAAETARDQEKAKADSFATKLEELQHQLEQASKQLDGQSRAEQEAKIALEKLLATSEKQVQNLETTLKRLQEKEELDHSTQTPSLIYSDSCAQTERQVDPTDEIKTKAQELGIAIDLLWGRYGTRNPIQLRTAPSGIDTKKWAEFLKAKAELYKILGITPTTFHQATTPQRGPANTKHTAPDSSGETSDDDGDNDAIGKSTPPSASVTSPFAASGAGLEKRKTAAPGPAFHSSEPHTAEVELLKQSETAAENDGRRQSAAIPPPKKAAVTAKFPAPKPAGKTARK